MYKKAVILLLSLLTLLNCSKESSEFDNSNLFPVLTYNAELSETLNLDINLIRIDKPKKSDFWTQHFQNPKNHLNNLIFNATFNNKYKIISGRKGPINIVQPIYFDNKLCHLKNDGFLECYDSQSNSLIFRIDIKLNNQKRYEVIRGGLAYFDEKIVLVDAYGSVLLVDSSDGKIIWTTNIDFPILSPPLIYRGFIYFISADNRIFAIDFNNGSIGWSFQVFSESKKNLFSASPVAFENTVIAPFSNGEIVSFIYDTGRPIWSESLSKTSLVSNFDIKDISASPVIADKTIYAMSSNGRLVSIDLINGKRNWAIDVSGYRTPLITGNQIYVINEEGKIICIERKSGEIFWISDLKKYRKGQNSANLNLWLGPYLINNLLYNVSYFGELKILSAINGDVLSASSIGVKGIMTPPIILSENIFLSDEKSNVFKFK